MWVHNFEDFTLTSRYRRFDVKIRESPAKSFYNPQNIKILKCNITGQHEFEILTRTFGLFTGKETDVTKKKKLILCGGLHIPDTQLPELN